MTNDKIPQTLVRLASYALLDTRQNIAADEETLVTLKAKMAEIQQRILAAKQAEGEVRHYLECNGVDTSHAALSAAVCTQSL